jgi:hypothetical protein
VAGSQLDPEAASPGAPQLVSGPLGVVVDVGLLVRSQERRRAPR